MDCCASAELSRCVSTLYVFVILVTDGGKFESENTRCSLRQRKVVKTKENLCHLNDKGLLR